MNQVELYGPGFPVLAEILVDRMLSYENQSDSDQDDEDIGFHRQKSGNMSAPEYKRLIAIHAGKVKKGLKHALRNGSGKVNRLSLSEQTLERAAASYPMDDVLSKNILRVFPKRTRVTSSNFDPTIGWMHGAQMIAFNMQAKLNGE
ncbi:phosphoinositide phospholipase C 4-like [Primulina tabacum]|uniref:phosphoinositide phospholipase C 4-like n=1 Tax=Primulina tabacum TaxID=48773 RepID=UPI003F59F50B